MRLSLARNSYAAVLMLAANVGTNDSHGAACPAQF
jgi:hypothetical protein